MALLKFPTSIKIDFIGWRWLTFSLSGLLVLLTLVTALIYGLNYGIDFKGGMAFEVQTRGNITMGTIRQIVHKTIRGDVHMQEFGSPQDFLIRIERQPGGESQQVQAVQKTKHALQDTVNFRRIEMVGPKVGEELIQKGLVAIFLALIAMLIYISFRFEWAFGICGFFALLHDCIAVMALFVLGRFEFNETAIVALLITASYSINDTVVIFDRFRENRQKHPQMVLPVLLNMSLNETFSRTVLTSVTTLMALLVLYFFGGPVIADFSLPIIVGITVGTYSSIYLVAPLLLLFQKSLEAQANEKEGSV